MKILVKNNKERVKNQEVEMKKVQKLLRRSLATGLALVMTVSSMTIVPGSWQVHAAEASGQIGISNADELKKIGKDKDYPMDGDYVLTDDIDLSGSDWTPIGGSGGSLTGKEGSAKKITLPKATTKVTAKAKTDKTVVLSWKKVKGATGYLLYRSTKKNGSYQRIAVLKKGTKCTYTDKKGLKKGMKYYYRIVTVKKKTYSPAKTTKAVKIKAAKKK